VNVHPILSISAVLLMLSTAHAEERQLTFSPKNHDLDNADNFSTDCKFLCYDTRGTVGPGIENCQSIEKVEIETGVETVLYKPTSSIRGEKAAPGVGAPFFSPVENKVAFIHGPPVREIPDRGYYAKPNRNGAAVIADGSGKMIWLDKRDTATTRDTIPGAHRGGTHRHEYSLDGRRIGFTYDDLLLPQYDRSIGYMEKHPKAPKGATHYFCILVPVVPKGTAKPGQIERAWGDSWVGARGLMRAFIGKVRAANGVCYEQSLFVIDIPADVDITTADSGSATRFPRPPEDVRVRRLTHGYAEGIVRGTVEGDRIAYYGLDETGTKQLFIIACHGSDQHPDPAKRPIQATHFENGAGPGLRWHPSGNSIACISNNGVAVTCVKPGPHFGKTTFLTPQEDEPALLNLVWSPDGRLLAFNKRTPTVDENGKRLHTYDGQNFLQIFLVDFPDPDDDGIIN